MNFDVYTFSDRYFSVPLKNYHFQLPVSMSTQIVETPSYYIVPLQIVPSFGKIEHSRTIIPPISSKTHSFKLQSSFSIIQSSILGHSYIHISLKNRQVQSRAFQVRFINKCTPFFYILLTTFLNSKIIR